jgi:hypothetical protein
LIAQNAFGRRKGHLGINAPFSIKPRDFVSPVTTFLGFFDFFGALKGANRPQKSAPEKISAARQANPHRILDSDRLRAARGAMAQ